jgi:hypothetical protein
MFRIIFFLVIAGFGINDAARDFLADRFGLWQFINLGMSAFVLLCGILAARRFANSHALLVEAEKDVDDLQRRLDRQVGENINLHRTVRHYLGSLRSARDFLVDGKDADAFRMIADALAEDSDTSIKKES